MCSCANGYKLGQDHKSCIPHGESSICEKWEEVVSLLPPHSAPLHTRSFSYNNV